MKSSTNRWLSIAGILCLAVLLYWGITDSQLERRARAAQEDADATFLRLKHDLPPGSPYAEVTAYIGSNGEQSTEINGYLSIHLGRIPSTEWFCSFFDDYAKLTFTGGGRLERMDRETIGECL